MKKDVFDELVVVKRSGQRVNFNNYKVAVAIKNAFDSFDGKYDESNINSVYENVLKNIEVNYVTRKTINVEDIQDIIEQELKIQNYYEVYDEFSQYRQKRAESRQAFKVKQQHKFAKAMEKITEDNLIDPEMLKKPREILLEYGKTVLDEFVKSYVIDNKYLRMHDEGNIYIRNLTNASLGRVSHTNLMIEDFLANCSNINEAIEYLINVKDEVNGEIHISSFDKLLSKCVLNKFKVLLIDNLKKYLKVAGYENYVNINTLSNVICNYDDINILPSLNNFALNNSVCEVFKYAYDDTISELKTNFKANILCLLEKLEETNLPYSFSFGETSSYLINFVTELIFEILDESATFVNVSFIYKLITLDDPYLNVLFKIIKDNKNILIQNKLISNNLDIEYFSNGIKIYDNFNDKDYSSGRMVVSEVSINMARIGIICKDNERKDFYNKLSEILDLAKNELLLMFEMIGNKNKDNYEILFDNNIFYDEKLETGGKIRKVIKNSDLLIGLCGLKECVDVLEDNQDKKYTLLCDILNFVNSKCSLYREETKLNFYSYEPYDYKPRHYFMGLDKTIYGIKKCITDKESYDLVSSANYLQDNYENMSNVLNLFVSGNLFIKNIKSNLSYKKFNFILNEFLSNHLGLIRFERG